VLNSCALKLCVEKGIYSHGKIEKNGSEEEVKEQGRREEEDGVAALMPGQYIIRITNECFACGDGILLARSFDRPCVVSD
jgi:hypothetical protein